MQLLICMLFVKLEAPNSVQTLGAPLYYIYMIKTNNKNNGNILKLTPFRIKF